MLEDRNNTMIFLWEIYYILMQISFIVLVLQHGRRAHTLYDFILVQCRYLVASTFFITRGSKSREAPSNLRT